MAHRKVCRRVIFLLIAFLMASNGFGEERSSGQAAGRMSAQAREALAESLPRREKELALRARKDVLAEVEQRIQEMDVSASADELTDLLEQRAYLEIKLDKCRVGSSEAGGCQREAVA